MTPEEAIKIIERMLRADLDRVSRPEEGICTCRGSGDLRERDAAAGGGGGNRGKGFGFLGMHILRRLGLS